MTSLLFKNARIFDGTNADCAEGMYLRVADGQDRGTAWSRARLRPGAVHPLVASRTPSLAERTADAARPDDCDFHAGLQPGRSACNVLTR